MPDTKPFSTQAEQRTCIVCSSVFVATTFNQICCNAVCSVQRQRDIAKGRYQRYREKNPWKSRAKKCVECGIRFVLQIRQHNKKTCSEDCRKRHLNKMSVGYRNRDRAEDPELYFKALREKRLQAKLRTQAKERRLHENEVKES